MSISVTNIVSKIINEKYLISKEESLYLYKKIPTEELCNSANKIRQSCCSKNSNICSIINAKQGGCSENCHYCAQSSHWNTSCTPLKMVTPQKASELSLLALNNKVKRIALVTAGKGLCGKDFETALECFKKILKDSDNKMAVCASLGIISEEQMQQLKEAGVSRYHHNLETSKKFYKNICTTHTYEDRVNTIKLAKKAGLQICCGGIIGMGESKEDRIDLALAIRELNVQSVPINILTPIQGTPLENIEPISKDEVLRTIAMFRFIMPSQTIRCAAGRKKLGNNGIDAFLSGANAMISGDFLTTPGSTNNEDVEMMKSLGYEV